MKENKEAKCKNSIIEEGLVRRRRGKNENVKGKTWMKRGKRIKVKRRKGELRLFNYVSTFK